MNAAEKKAQQRASSSMKRSFLAPSASAAVNNNLPASAPKAAAASVPAAAPGLESGVVPYAILVGDDFPDHVDTSQKETYLSEAEFQEHFRMPLADFEGKPRWKKDALKKAAKLY